MATIESPQRLNKPKRISSRTSTPEPSKSRPKIRRNRVTASTLPSTSKVTLDIPSKPADLPQPPSEPRSSRRSRRDKKYGRNGVDGEAPEFGNGVDFIDLVDSDQEKDSRRRSRSPKREKKEKKNFEKDDRTKRRKKKGKERDEAPDASLKSGPLGTGADFISFVDSEDEKGEDVTPEDKPTEREWDRGKRRARSLDRADERRRERAKYEPQSRYSSRRRIPWLEGVEFDKCNNIAEVLFQEVSAFTKWMSPTPEEDEIRGLVVQRIRNAVVSQFGDARVEPFGSYATKLYLPSGDIDLVIISDSMAYNDRVKVLHALASTLKRAGVTDRVSIIAKARVPIVKFVTTLGMFHVDISINQANGLVGVEMINGFLSRMHGEQCLALRSLVLIVKLFLSQRSMNEVYTGGLGSYAIVCLVISFLQMHPKIRNSEIDVERNVGVLVMEFFELYGCFFNYGETGISIRDGGTYFSKRQRGWYNDYKGLMLSIEDPADPSNDISAGSFGFSKVKATMAGAHSILTSTVYQKAGILNARRSGQAVSLRERYDPEDLSILSSIMTVPQETINQRRVVTEVYDSGELHRILGVQPLAKVHNGSVSNSNGKKASVPSPVSISSDMEMESDHEEDAPHGHKRSRDDEDEEESGRYGIGNREEKERGRPPPRKRRRLDESLYTTDDDDTDAEEDGEMERDFLLSNGIGEDADVDDVASREKVIKPRSKNGDRNRQYWLAKAKGPHNGQDGFGEDGVLPEVEK